MLRTSTRRSCSYSRPAHGSSRRCTTLEAAVGCASVSDVDGNVIGLTQPTYRVPNVPAARGDGDAYRWALGFSRGSVSGLSSRG
jgi:hypothetical protein